MYSKEEIAELIIKNPQEYNTYKKTVEELDLTELDFSNITLEEIDFSNCELAGTSFNDAHVSNCNFTGADLNAADFTRANIVECDFSESILNGTDFSYAAVNYCNFADADMAGCIVKEADLSFANLETPVDKNVPYSTYPNFNVHSAYAQATFDAGFCVFSLANNHTNDQGRDGIIETRNYFSEVRESTKDSERPIYSAGLKEKSGGDLTYEVIEKNGWKILFVAFTELLNSPTASSWIDYIPPTKERRESLIKELVKLRKENPCDLFVVSIHTSEPEYVFEITEKQKNFYYDLLESSADVIWCNHPHVSKKWEVVNIQGKAKKIIFYDMGNTISAQRTNPQFKNPETLRDYTGDGYMARVRFVKNQGETQIVFVDPILLTTYITPENQYVIKILNDNFLSELKSQENHKWADYLFERKKLMEKIKGTTTWQ